jgi:hypothetical protein
VNLLRFTIEIEPPDVVLKVVRVCVFVEVCLSMRECVYMCKHMREYCEHQSVYSLSSGRMIQVELPERALNSFFSALQPIELPDQCLSTIKRRKHDTDDVLRSTIKIR